MALKPLNSVAGFSVGETPTSIILANGDITTNNITTTGVANLNSIGNVKITGGSNGQVIQTDGLGNLSFVTISTASLSNGNSNIQVLANGNITFSSAGTGNVVVISDLGEYITGILSVTGNANFGNIGTSGVLTATGNITGANLATGGILTVTGNANVGNLGTAGIITATGTITGGNLNTSGNLSVAGNVTGNNITTGGLITATGNVTAGNVVTGGIITATGNVSGANLTTGGVITATGNITGGNIDTGGLVTATGNVTGGNLTTGGLVTATGNVTGGNITTGGLVTATGNVTGGNLVTTGLANVGNFEISGVVTGNLIPSANVTYSLGNANNKWNDLYLAGNTIYLGNITLEADANDALLINKLSVTGNANIGNIGTGGLITATGNVTAGNIDTGGLVTATGNVTGGNLTTGGLVTATGNVTGGNLTTGGLVTATGNVTGGNVTTGGLVTATGNVTGGNLTTAGALSAGGNANVGNIGANIGVFTGNISSGNANLGNLATANYFQGDGSLLTNVPATGSLANGNSSVSIVTNGNVGITVAGNSNIAVFTGTGANINGYLTVTGNLSSGNANLGNLATANFVNVSSNLYVVDTANVGNLRTDNLLYANGTPYDFQQPAGANTQIQYNDGAGGFGASANFAFDYANNELELKGNILLGGNLVNQIVNLSNTSVEIRGGWGQNSLTGAALFAGDYANNTDWGKISILGNVGGNSAAITEANIAYWRSPAGVANIVSIDTISVNATNTSTGALVVSGGAGITGNVYIGGLLNVTGDIANANNISATNNLFANNANITSNLTSGNANLGNLAIANFVQTGEILNGNSNVILAANGNLLVSITGTANVLKVSNIGANIVGYVQANGNGTFGALYSNTLNATGGALTLNAGSGNNNIILVPTGTGNVDVSSRHIVQLADPNNPQDAATKAYVDSVATGLQIHTAVRVTSTTNLNATYANGGTALTTIAISGGKTIQFSAAHGLSIDDEIYWANSFNGITSLNGYFVETTPASDTITVRATYTGAEVTTLTNGTGLTQGATGNPGIGATLTNAGANAALSIDGISLASTNRVLVQGQTNQFENGVYTVTTVGNGSTAWVLTRATDGDQYAPTDVNKLGYGDYFFVSQGSSYAGSSYVLTAPTGEIVFGITNIGFSQFAASGSFTAGNGIAIVGTVISANVDGVTTDIVSGNIVVKANAQLTTPNIGAATGTSLDLTGNLLAGNVNSNAKVTAANIEVTSNVLANNFSANANITANNATVNLELSGNTANFSGNVRVNNITVNNYVNGNIGNFSGNVNAAFLKAGTGNVIPNLTNPLFSGISSANNFIQAYIYNESNGTAASADFIAYPNNGDDVSGWIDLGITSNTFNQATFSVTEENEGYIFMSAPDLSGTSGNLVIATDSTGSNNSIEFFVDGFTKAKNQRSMLIDTTGVTVTGNFISANATLGNLASANFFSGDGSLLTNVSASGSLSNGNSSVTIPSANGNVLVSVAGNANIAVFTGTGANINGTLSVSGNATTANLSTGILSATGNVVAGNLITTGYANVNKVNVGNSTINTQLAWDSVTTTSISANQTIASISTTGVTGLEFLVKGVDSVGSKYSVATVIAVTDGANVDYSVFGTVLLGSYTGVLAVNIVGGTVRLQVTPASSNSTVWTTQYRTI